MKRVLLVAAALAVSAAMTAPAAAVIGEPPADSSAPILTEDDWTRGENKYTYLYGELYGWAGAMTPKQIPRAGEVFYVHAVAGLMWLFVTNDVFGMTLGLPDGVSVAASPTTPVRCFITYSRDITYVPKRSVTDGECKTNPSPTTGSRIPLGAFTLFSEGPRVGGERAHVFVPVVASRAVDAENILVLVNPSDPGAVPNEIPATAPLTVAPGAAPSQPTTPGGGSPTEPTTPGGGSPTEPSQPVALTKPTGKVFKWRKKGKVLVAWQPVPGATGYKARLKVGKKWTKWSTLADRGLKLTKLKRGKKYVLQVRAIGPNGSGPMVTWRFKGK